MGAMVRRRGNKIMETMFSDRMFPYRGSDATGENEAEMEMDSSITCDRRTHKHNHKYNSLMDSMNISAIERTTASLCNGEDRQTKSWFRRMGAHRRNMRDVILPERETKNTEEVII